MIHALFSVSLGLLCLLAPATTAQTATGDSNARRVEHRFFELRTYYAPADKLDELQARFRNHTLKIFENHGIQNVGYWVPVENSENKLVYLLAYPSRAARETSWKEFFADPAWQKVQKESEAAGKLVAKVDSLFLVPTDYSPAVEPSRSSEARLFELRTYTAAPDKLDELNARFRDKTLALFKKHGMTSIGYWVPADAKQGAGNTLVYLLAHPNKESATQSWKAFREDPDWTAAKSASERNGPLTVPNGVKSVYLQPTDYSPMR